MKLRLIASLFAATAVAGPACALDGPEELVRMVYNGLSIQDSAVQANRALARDAAAAYAIQLRASEPTDATGFDWRYGAQDWEVTELEVGRARDLPSLDGVAMADVPVSFRSFNGPTQTITWTMCLGRKGWRVADVRGSDSDGEWRLRTMLGLQTDKVRC